jgi:hypothetical protein
MSKKLDAEISRLKKEHTRLDNEIDKMEKTGHFEDLKLTQLKKQRLAIRDQLTALYKRQYEDREYVDFDDDRR